MRSYLISMGTRIVAFPIAVWLLLSGWQVIGWTIGIAAIVLPSFAVAIANAADRRQQTVAPPVASPVQPLGASAAEPEPGPSTAAEPTIIPGSVIRGSAHQEAGSAPYREHEGHDQHGSDRGSSRADQPGSSRADQPDSPPNDAAGMVS